jgi:hypothetical protein
VYAAYSCLGQDLHLHSIADAQNRILGFEPIELVSPASGNDGLDFIGDIWDTVKSKLQNTIQNTIQNKILNQ